MLVLFGITHFAAIIWLIVVRHEKLDGADDTWYDAWEEEEATDFEEYVDSVFWAT
jgi:hypothetical protein